MSVHVEVRGGAAALRKLAADLRQADRVDLQRELQKGLRDAAKPLYRRVIEEIRSIIPHRGGYSEILARAYYQTVSVRTVGGGAGMTVIGRAKGKAELRDVDAVNRGVLRHPVYGHRSRWATTSVPPGFFDNPARELEDDLVRNAEAALDRVADKLERG